MNSQQQLQQQPPKDKAPGDIINDNACISEHSRQQLDAIRSNHTCWIILGSLVVLLMCAGVGISTLKQARATPQVRILQYADGYVLLLEKSDKSETLEKQASHSIILSADKDPIHLSLIQPNADQMIASKQTAEANKFQTLIQLLDLTSSPYILYSDKFQPQFSSQAISAAILELKNTQQGYLSITNMQRGINCKDLVGRQRGNRDGCFDDRLLRCESIQENRKLLAELPQKRLLFKRQVLMRMIKQGVTCEPDYQKPAGVRRPQIVIEASQSQKKSPTLTHFDDQFMQLPPNSSMVRLNPSQRQKYLTFLLNQQKYFIDYNKLTPTYTKQSQRNLLERLQIIDRIQLNSRYDYLNLTSNEAFLKLKQQWQHTIPYELYGFKYDPNIQKQPTYQQLTLGIKQLRQIQGRIRLKSQQMLRETYPVNLALPILLTNYLDDPQIRELQYLYYNRRYKIGSYGEELPMCIYSNGYNLASKGRLREYFQSIQQQNYSNYRVVYVDDRSTDNTVPIMYDFIRNSSLSLKNKIRIAYNMKRLRGTGNSYLRMKQFCPPDSIVVNVDADDKLIGTQVLKTLNAVYQNPEMWFVHSLYLMQLQQQNKWLFGYSSDKFIFKSEEYRMKIQWTTSHLKTFRAALLQKVPLQNYLQFHLNHETNKLQPVFYRNAADRFPVYNLIEMSGNKRMRTLMQGLYFYYHYQTPRISNCYMQHLMIDEFKSRMKYRLSMLKDMDDEVTFMPKSRQIIPPNIINRYANAQAKIQSCINNNPWVRAERLGLSFKLFKKATQTKQMFNFSGEAELKVKFNCTQVLILKHLEAGDNFSRVLPLYEVNQESYNTYNFAFKKAQFSKYVDVCGVLQSDKFYTYLLTYPFYGKILIQTDKNQQIKAAIYQFVEFISSKMAQRFIHIYNVSLDSCSECLLLTFLAPIPLQPTGFPQNSPYLQLPYLPTFADSLKQLYQLHNIKTSAFLCLNRQACSYGQVMPVAPQVFEDLAQLTTNYEWIFVFLPSRTIQVQQLEQIFSQVQVYADVGIGFLLKGGWATGLSKIAKKYGQYKTARLGDDQMKLYTWGAYVFWKPSS